VEVEAVIFCSVLMRRELIESIGLLDEGFSPLFCEEDDYCTRTRAAGYKVVYEPRATILHHLSMSTAKLDDNFKFFLYRKNRIRNELLNFPLTRLPLAFIFEFASLFLTKKVPMKRLSLPNIALRKAAVGKLGLSLRAWQVNLKNLREILEKRRNRAAKIWC
jgi:GT2 family glycosyltransferase